MPVVNQACEANRHHLVLQHRAAQPVRLMVVVLYQTSFVVRATGIVHARAPRLGNIMA